MYTLTVTSELDKLASIACFVADAANALGMNEDGVYAMQLAVDEACTNVMDYAYQGRGGQPLTIECEEKGGRCVITIRDQGRPFDPARVRMPNTKAPVSKRRVGGLGIYLMRKLMDDVRFRFDPQVGNEVILVKAIK